MRRLLDCLLFALVFTLWAELASSSTECLWSTGLVECRKNQTRVIGAIVEVYDLDSPANSAFKNPLDPDDKVGLSLVGEQNGLWNVEGCASDQDWFPGIPNKPEFYIKVRHRCNKAEGEVLQVPGVFRVFMPQTYAHHINNPIVLDDNYDAAKDEMDGGYEVIDIGGAKIDRTIEIADERLKT